MALPIVKEETVGSVLAKMRGPLGELNCQMEHIRSEIERENPQVVKMARAWASALKGANSRRMAEYCGLFVYCLLKSQDDADQLLAELQGRI